MVLSYIYIYFKIWYFRKIYPVINEIIRCLRCLGVVLKYLVGSSEDRYSWSTLGHILIIFGN